MGELVKYCQCVGIHIKKGSSGNFFFTPLMFFPLLWCQRLVKLSRFSIMLTLDYYRGSFNAVSKRCFEVSADGLSS